MHPFSSSTLLSMALSALLSLTAVAPAVAAPTPQAPAAAGGSSSYWLAQSSMHGNDNSKIWGNTIAGYPLFRDVTHYGAKGDGVTDDTAAINLAINATSANAPYTSSAETRCGLGCNSSTITPAMVYFPPGKYLVSSPIIMEYYTQLIGDAIDPPTLVASSGFAGMAVIDADPYGAYGVNWYINQNNFFRQVRNFVIDIRQWGGGMAGAGIHWQVAQATSLQNIVFEMSTASGTKQVGIFMDNGSGGFMSDLTFNGGFYGAFFGNQQFTSRNMIFNGCQTGIYMNWNWGWTLQNMTFNSCGVGIDVSQSGDNQTVGSVVLADSTFSGTTYGVRSDYSTSNNQPATGGTLILDNVDLSGTTQGGVVNKQNAIIYDPKAKVQAWASGNVYDNSGTGKTTQGTITPPVKNSQLLLNGNIFGRSKPQYENVPTSGFLRSIQDGNCRGDGSTDDTACLQAFLKNAQSQGKIAYIEHGAYLVKDTVTVPANLAVVGEVWSTIVASGFNDANNPKPVFQIGNVGDTGYVELSDLLFEILGPNPGAIMVQWNLASNQGASGMWDCHVRMGGSVNSELLLSNCPAESGNADVTNNCIAGFMMFYAHPQSSNVYLENVWLWTADHDMEDPLNRQISVYNARGMLIKSQGPVWLWGTASEHSVMYNYQFDGVQALFAGFIQSETPYYQPYPLAPAPFSYNSAFDDPNFSNCNGADASSTNVPCKDSWGLRVVQSQNVLVYSTGFYSFFNGYTQDCVAGENCQENMISIEGSKVSMYAVTTKASLNMIQDDAGYTITGAANRDVFGDTIAYYNTH